jgi:transposase
MEGRHVGLDFYDLLIEIFKGAANRASCGVGPLRDFYVALLDKGMKPEMARLTLARKIAAIALILWKKEERFDAEQLKNASRLSAA